MNHAEKIERLTAKWVWWKQCGGVAGLVDRSFLSKSDAEEAISYWRADDKVRVRWQSGGHPFYGDGPGDGYWTIGFKEREQWS